MKRKYREYYPQGLHGDAAYMRDFPTSAEREMWRYLRKGQVKGLRFVRQVVIEPYLVDFLCRKERLIVEVGSRDSGEKKKAFLKAKGYEVVRIPPDLALTRPDIAIDGIVNALGGRAYPDGPTEIPRVNDLERIDDVLQVVIPEIFETSEEDS